mmetsp:Transcript_10141/g.14645  ORF Transcript_10141/g.14645 Transcript_10141/m.14645 type:complete len:97 (-) Transcript_10141:64-354(-)
MSFLATVIAAFVATATTLWLLTCEWKRLTITIQTRILLKSAFTKIEKGEKEDLFDSSLAAPAKNYDETVFFHDVQGLRIASPKNSPNGRNSACNLY